MIANDPPEMASDTGTPSPYTVDIAPAAWRRLASFPQETYLMVQERLRELAALATQGRLSTRRSVQESAGTPSATFVVGDFAARYETDEGARIVRLVAVENRLHTAPHDASHRKPERLFE